jgi:rhodanese-related sulfurtransferase
MNSPVSEISRHELQSKLASRAPIVLLEALPAPYYQRGHLPGARNLPHDRVRALAETVAPEKDAEIVVYCASPTCQNSHVAAGVLSGLGYGNVRVFRGGKQEWEEAGLALEVGGAP